MGGLEDKSTDSAYYFGINMMFIPEFLLWIACTLLFWQYLIMFYIAHINFSMNSISKDVLPVPLRSKSFNIMIAMIIVFIIIQSIFVVLFNAEILNLNVLFLEDMIINYALPVIAIITQFILHLKFSGAPYVSNNYKEKKKTMTKIIIYWTIARALKATFTLILYVVQANIINDFIEDEKDNKSDQSTQLLEIIIFFINYFFSELIAFSLTMNKRVSKIFRLYQYSNPIKFGENSKAFLFQEDGNSFAITPKLENLNRSINLKNLFKNLDLSKLSYENNVVSNVSLNKFGTIRKAFYYSKAMAIRNIDIENISNFIIEEVQEDMAILIKLDWMQIIPIKGIYYDNKKIILMNDFLEESSLESFMLKGDLSINEDDPRMKIALEIANSLQYMHENNIFHGHLTPNNIFITNNYKARILDCKFKGLKKLASFQRGYCNKSKYTAPEHLKEKTQIVKACNQGSDVYSFGIILWELLENKKAFENLNMRDLNMYVVEKQSRPKISEGINQNVSQLIRACWQEDVGKRPSFKVICKILEQNLN